MDVRPLSGHRNPYKEEKKNTYHEFKVIPGLWVWKVGWLKQGLRNYLECLHLTPLVLP